MTRKGKRPAPEGTPLPQKKQPRRGRGPGIQIRENSPERAPLPPVQELQGQTVPTLGGTPTSKYPPDQRRLRFITKLASESRRYLCSRPVSRDNFWGFGIVEPFDAYGWGVLIDFEGGNWCKRIVLEFMSTLNRKDNGELTGEVDGRRVTITHSEVSDFLKVDPKVRGARSRYQDYDLVKWGHLNGRDIFPKDSGYPTYGKLHRFVCDEDVDDEDLAKHNDLHRSKMTPRFQVLQRIVKTNICPRGGDETKVRFRELFILWAIVTRALRLSLAHIILDVIWDAYDFFKSGCIPHCILLSRLLQMKGCLRTAPVQVQNRTFPADKIEPKPNPSSNTIAHKTFQNTFEFTRTESEARIREIRAPHRSYIRPLTPEEIRDNESRTRIVGSGSGHARVDEGRNVQKEAPQQQVRDPEPIEGEGPQEGEGREEEEKSEEEGSKESETEKTPSGSTPEESDERQDKRLEMEVGASDIRVPSPPPSPTKKTAFERRSKKNAEREQRRARLRSSPVESDDEDEEDEEEENKEEEEEEEEKTSEDAEDEKEEETKKPSSVQSNEEETEETEWRESLCSEETGDKTKTKRRVEPTESSSVNVGSFDLNVAADEPPVRYERPPPSFGEAASSFVGGNDPSSSSSSSSESDASQSSAARGNTPPPSSPPKRTPSPMDVDDVEDQAEVKTSSGTPSITAHEVHSVPTRASRPTPDVSVSVPPSLDSSFKFLMIDYPVSSEAAMHSSADIPISRETPREVPRPDVTMPDEEMASPTEDMDFDEQFDIRGEPGTAPSSNADAFNFYALAEVLSEISHGVSAMGETVRTEVPRGLRSYGVPSRREMRADLDVVMRTIGTDFRGGVRYLLNEVHAHIDDLDHEHDQRYRGLHARVGRIEQQMDRIEEMVAETYENTIGFMVRQEEIRYAHEQEREADRAIHAITNDVPFVSPANYVMPERGPDGEEWVPRPLPPPQRVAAFSPTQPARNAQGSSANQIASRAYTRVFRRPVPRARRARISIPYTPRHIAERE